MVGTISSAFRVMAGSKKLAFGPSAKYSSHAEESTRFTSDRVRGEHGYRCPAGTRALASIARRVDWQRLRLFSLTRSPAIRASFFARVHFFSWISRRRAKPRVE